MTIDLSPTGWLDQTNPDQENTVTLGCRSLRGDRIRLTSPTSVDPLVQGRGAEPHTPWGKTDAGDEVIPQ